MPRDLIIKRPLVLTPVRPNLGIMESYKSKLDRMIDEMQRSLVYWLSAAFRSNPPEILELAADMSPAMTLRAAMRRLTRVWTKKFEDAAPDLASHFARDVSERSDANLRAILRRGGFSVKFKLTAPMNDALQATIGEQVGLITNIAQQHLAAVEGAVMRSVTRGRDLHALQEELQHTFGITKRRAANISRDQNNKATGTVQRVRQLDLGLVDAHWIHSAGGKVPRPTHVKASKDRVIYKIAKGWYDPAVNKFIIPGELPYCRCVGAPIIPGLEDL